MKSREQQSLWTVVEADRFFLIPDGLSLAPGSLRLTNRLGQSKSVDPSSAKSFEVNEAEALRWAKEELGQTLDELKHNIDEKLGDWRRELDEFKQTPVKEDSSVTPAAGAAFFDFLTQLPRIVRDSVSGDRARVDSARKATAELEEKFKKSGLPVDERLRNFPDRMAKIHESGPTQK